MNAISLPGVVEPTTLPVTLRAALENAADLAANEKSPATRKAYAADWRIFDGWCAATWRRPSLIFENRVRA